MRFVLALVSIVALLGGCTPEIPVKPQFGTSALKPTGNIPPEFAAFDNYDPRVNALLAEQICATPYILEVEKTAEAVPGELVTATGRCETYLPPFANPNQQMGP